MLMQPAKTETNQCDQCNGFLVFNSCLFSILFWSLKNVALVLIQTAVPLCAGQQCQHFSHCVKLTLLKKIRA